MLNEEENGQKIHSRSRREDVQCLGGWFIRKLDNLLRLHAASSQLGSKYLLNRGVRDQ